MLTVTINPTTNEVETTGAVEVGDAYQDYCCAGYDWEVLTTFPDSKPERVSIWGKCSNPACPRADAEDDPWREEFPQTETTK
jgi:hypothetical protein